MTFRQRNCLLLGGSVSVFDGLCAQSWNRLTGRGLSFVDIPQAPPFRRLEPAGQTSTATVAPVGLDAPFPHAGARRARKETMLTDDPSAYRHVKHALPIFGAASKLAARASVAAAREGKPQEQRRHFMRTPLVADESAVRRVAADLDLEVERHSIDMAFAGVQAELDRRRTGRSLRLHRHRRSADRTDRAEPCRAPLPAPTDCGRGEAPAASGLLTR